MNNPEIKKILIREIDAFASLNFKDYFIVLFGSFAINKQKENSDIDIICFSKSLDDELIFLFKDFFINLCVKYNVSTRAQIPHERFLIISYNDLLKAISGEGFTKTEKSELTIPERIHTAEFYSSDKMRFRFAFNSITTLNQFISGNFEHYKSFKDIAIEYLLGYIFILNNKRKLTIEELVNATICDSKTQRSEGMFLGYKNYSEIREHFLDAYQIKLKQLSNQNFVNFDSVSFLPSDNWLKKIFYTNAELHN
ncbi:MAG: nucleotidyltransferase domain-containing protein [Sphingobacteriales bacterium]|nr:nucleotidyltransferase domain-containing protein [Sphingobacteriales bacterium]